MKLHELKSLLRDHEDLRLSLQLPNGRAVPGCFHITEVGLIDKKFIDCGGKVHATKTCQLQAWIGEDVDHRLSAGKLTKILGLATKIVSTDDIEVEVEYEDAVISQYPIAGYEVYEDALLLRLTGKHTDCLAKELCLLPTVSGDSCCGPAGCC